MKSNSMWLLAAAVALAVGAGALPAARGESALDSALSDTAKPVAPAKTDAAPAVAPATDANAPATPDTTVKEKPTRPNLPDIISPRAAKTLDDQDLLDKLTGKGNADGGKADDPEQKMNVIMDRMGKSQTLLFQEKDPGEMTQEVQSRIVIDLDSMIELLKKQDQKSKSQGSGDPKPGEKKQQPGDPMPGSGPKSEGGNTAAQQSQLGGSSEAPNPNQTPLNDGRIGWGGLPPKERDVVTNGVKEKYLPEYRDMLKHYYESLAEIGQSSKER